VSFLVTRYAPAIGLTVDRRGRARRRRVWATEKVYGPFQWRALAEAVARRTAEKYRGDIVSVHERNEP